MNVDEIHKRFIIRRNYMPKKITINDFTPLIPDEQCKEMMSAKQYKRFVKWMFGQTRSPWGYYRWDVERFLNGDKSWD